MGDVTKSLEGLVENTELNLEVVNPPEIDSTKSTIALVVGASGGGKDATCKDFCNGIDSEGNIIGDPTALVSRVITSTTRAPRQGETALAYNFVNLDSVEGESSSDLAERAKKTLDLIESSAHMGSVYGVPRGGVEGIREQGVGVIRMEIFGAQKIQEVLKEMGFNTIIVAIQAEGIDELRGRIRGREPGMSEEKLKVRLERAEREIALENEIANYIIRNNNGSLKKSKKSFEALILGLKEIHDVEVEI